MTEAASPAPLAAPGGRAARRPSWALLAFAVVVASAASAGLALRLRVTSTSKTPEGHTAMPGMESEAPPRPAGAGDKAVYISAARQQLVGVRTGTVERQSVEGTVRTVGVLAYDETHVANIHTKISGWVERLFVDYVGKSVRRGQPLFSVYSPDLVTAQTDYLIALGVARKPSGTVVPEAKAGADALLEASRLRLKRWDISDAEIAALERSGLARKTLTLSSPFDGVVLEKTAFAGQYITPDMTTFKLADLSSVWAVGQVFEYEAARFHVGDAVKIEFPYGQATALDGRIDFIYPEVDPQTRRVRFRVTLPNVDLKLKPDTYVSLVWQGEAVDRLVVPKEAVIDTGERKYVLLALANGYFEPRDVQIGPPMGAFYPVVSGVADGDRVVTSAQFLVDSETNLMAAMQSMSMSMPGMDMGAPKDKKTPAPSMSSMPGMPSAPPSATSAPHQPDMPPMPGMP